MLSLYEEEIPARSGDFCRLMVLCKGKSDMNYVGIPKQ